MTTQKQVPPKGENSENSHTFKPRDGVLPGVLPPNLQDDYVAGAVMPYLKAEFYMGEQPLLPMIELALSKEDAQPIQLMGLFYEGWAANSEGEGLSIFVRPYDKRGPNNLSKKIYMSALTPDLIETKYHSKIAGFLERFLAESHDGKPMLENYFDNYFNLYWDLYVGAKPDEIPDAVRQFSAAFSASAGFWFPNLEIMQQNYLRARKWRGATKEWLDNRVQTIADGKLSNADSTFVYYWLKNAGSGEYFRRIDVIFECANNLLATSHWGATLCYVAGKLEATDGDPDIKAWFARTMSNGPDKSDGSPFTPLERFVMELLRVITPNPGSLSRLQGNNKLLGLSSSAIVTPHLPANMDPRQWKNPTEFDPDRFKTARTSADNDEARAKQIGLERCPFSKEAFPVKDGRKVEITNSVFGAAYSEVDGKPHPVVDTAGYASFGFGYRRCPGELLSMDLLKTFLRLVWQNKISFVRLDIDNPRLVPFDPGTLLPDNIAFRRAK